MLMIVMLFGGCRKEEEQIDAYARLRSVQRLELARMAVGKVGIISDKEPQDAGSLSAKAEALVNNMKVGTRIGVYSYDTYLVAYMDLGKLTSDDVRVDAERKMVSVLLPEVEVMTDGRDPQLREEHVRVTGFRSAITPEERAALKAQMAREVNEDLKKHGKDVETLRKTAAESARELIERIVSSWGYEADVQVRTQAATGGSRISGDTNADK